MQEETTSVAAAATEAAASTPVGLNIHKGKSKILLYIKYNTTCTNLVIIDREALQDVKTFTYLVSMIDEHSESDADVKAWIGKARTAYLQLENIWKSKQLSSSQHRGHNFQYECEDSSTVWGENSENYESYHAEDTSVY
ncbi:unnamed protein product [Schistosoma mattheei]|uniref:Uncharacterized protein n=1 Tax=Schistosoma mattheei TaxID=31246 RepID=A0A183PFX2_9TREM|nr:unnamed protein product [Schistosoma mattheei]